MAYLKLENIVDEFEFVLESVSIHQHCIPLNECGSCSVDDHDSLTLLRR